MSAHSSYQSNSDSSDILATKYCSMTPTNHLIGPDGIILGVTYPKINCGLTNYPNSGSYINYQGGGSDANSSCTIL